MDSGSSLSEPDSEMDFQMDSEVNDSEVEETVDTLIEKIQNNWNIDNMDDILSEDLQPYKRADPMLWPEDILRGLCELSELSKGQHDTVIEQLQKEGSERRDKLTKPTFIVNEIHARDITRITKRFTDAQRKADKKKAEKVKKEKPTQPTKFKPNPNHEDDTDDEEEIALAQGKRNVNVAPKSAAPNSTFGRQRKAQHARNGSERDSQPAQPSNSTNGGQAAVSGQRSDTQELQQTASGRPLEFIPSESENHREGIRHRIEARKQAKIAAATETRRRLSLIQEQEQQVRTGTSARSGNAAVNDAIEPEESASQIGRRQSAVNAIDAGMSAVSMIRRHAIPHNANWSERIRLCEMQKELSKERVAVVIARVDVAAGQMNLATDQKELSIAQDRVRQKELDFLIRTYEIQQRAAEEEQG